VQILPPDRRGPGPGAGGAGRRLRCAARRIPPCALVALLLLALLLAAGADAADAAPAPALPDLDLPVVTRGERAIDALGAHLPAVARAYGLTAAELRRRLRSDASLAVDRRGRLVFTCWGLAADGPVAPGTEGAAVGFTTPAPLADTFTLHSRPGAKRVIYLDVDGDVLVGNSWNTYTKVSTIVCPPWNTDGDPSVFGEAERVAIQRIWLRVAEDYAPFDVDVTTQEPPAGAITRSSLADDIYGTRVLISPISQYFGTYGGIAAVGIYNYVDSTDHYKPALVFPEQLAHDEKRIAEAAAHEAGHNLGLIHDGVLGGSAYYAGHGEGETGWAPIMGVGYGRNLTQWSKGEYHNADNPENDLAVMQSYGLSYRGDDHGDTFIAATALPAGASLSGGGVIGRAGDVDVFSFSAGAGPASITVAPADTGPDLDVQAELIGEGGSVLTTSNPVDLLRANLMATLPAAGTYHLRVRGVGKGDPKLTGYTAYGSLGHYRISGTVPAQAVLQAPSAVAVATPPSGVAPLKVSFDGSGSSQPGGSIDAYAWGFGDGAGATGVTAAHTYEHAGDYTATLTVTGAGGLSASATSNVRVTDASTLTLSAPSPSAYASATLSGRLRTAGGDGIGAAALKVQSSRDGTTWAAIADAVTRADGSYTAKVAPTRTTHYRVRFAGRDLHANAMSTGRIVKPRVYLTVPAAPATVRRGALFTASGFLRPRHTPGTYPVTIACYRYEAGQWKLRKTVRAKASDYSSYTRYRVSLSLGSRGSWRIKAHHAADTLNANTWSGARSVRVD
jgi:phage baseplate assembly protein gpV